MERRDIEVFLALAEELHFGRAAERLHVTTARVSQTIKQLERRFGSPLFERTSRRVELTAIGRRLRDDLAPAMRQVDEAIARAIAAGRGVTGTLRVGFIGAAAGGFVMEVADAFAARHPDCAVEIRESQFSDGLDLVASGAIDMLLATHPVAHPALSCGPVLFTEERLLAVSARHPFARKASVLFADLARDKVLRSPPAIPDAWDAALAPRHTPDGRPVERGPVFATVQEMLALVGAGKGIYPLPAQASLFYQRPDVAYVPIADQGPFEWSFWWPTAAFTSRVKAFAAVAEEVATARQQPDAADAPRPAGDRAAVGPLSARPDAVTRRG